MKGDIEMSPLPANDPRRKPKPAGPARGSKRGVGYRLLPGTKTFRGKTINQDVHPFGDARMGEVGQTNVTVEEAAKRYPEFDNGRAFAGLSPEAQEAVKQLVVLLGKGA